jgi:hypothetical protein
LGFVLSEIYWIFRCCSFDSIEDFSQHFHVSFLKVLPQLSFDLWIVDIDGLVRDFLQLVSLFFIDANQGLFRRYEIPSFLVVVIGNLVPKNMQSLEKVVPLQKKLNRFPDISC